MKDKILLLSAMLLAGIASYNISTAQPPDYRNRGNDDPPYYADNHDRYGNDRRYEYGDDSRMAVRIQPSAPYYRQGPAPSPYHVWIDAEWNWNRGRYDYIPGYWSRPPGRNMYYVAGRWERTRFGWVWVKGYWVKGRGHGRGPGRW